jgi:hypothetical protein
MPRGNGKFATINCIELLNPKGSQSIEAGMERLMQNLEHMKRVMVVALERDLESDDLNDLIPDLKELLERDIGIKELAWI